MVVLSIELDLVAQIARLLTDTLEAAGLLVQQWRPRKWCNPRQPESLTSHLQHAAKVVWSGQTFLCRMIYLLCCFRKKDHPIRLNLQFCLDLEWWHTFLSSWNGVSSWLFPGMSPPAWTLSFASTLSGGTPSCLHGMVSVLGFFLACLLLLTSKSFQMHLGL